MKRRQRRANDPKAEAPGNPFTGRAPFLLENYLRANILRRAKSKETDAA